MAHNSKVVTRFAPSPTGFIHVGNIRTALFAWLFARQQGGEFILRIEDTDKAREVEGSIQHIIDSLKWIGIDWDYGPNNPGNHKSCLQSERLDLYKAYAEKLIAKGLAYPDPYSEGEVEKFRAQAEIEKRPFLFRDYRPDTFETWDGTKPLRFKVPEIKRYTWNDIVRGELTAGEEALDDFILIKADGYPTYNFAHIVDDFEMGVTHIMRGQEFIASTPKFLSLYDALEIPYPIFVTMPPIMAADGKKKLGKRDGAKDILEYDKEGYLPEAMFNFLALIGWNPGTDQEIFTRDELVSAFTLEKIQRSGGAFNNDKLNWMNKEHLMKLPDEAFYSFVLTFLPETVKELPGFSEERLHRMLPIFRERISTGIELAHNANEGEYSWAFATPTLEAELMKWKNDTSVSDALPRLQEAMVLLKDSDFSSPEQIKSALWAYAEAVGKGELLWPLRVALSGRPQSPDPFTLAFILGKDETIERIGRACDKIGQ